MTELLPGEGPDVAFQKHLAAGQIKIQRGVESGTWVYYPRTVAPRTGENLEWAEISGYGTVYSTTVVRKRPPEPSLNIALVDLDEGPRLMSRVEGLAAADVRIGMRVKASIARSEGEEDAYIIVFCPAESRP